MCSQELNKSIFKHYQTQSKRVRIQVTGQEEVRSFLSDQLQFQMEQLFFFGRTFCQPEGPAWRDLRDSFSELLTHHLQQVIFPSKTCCPLFEWSSAMPLCT